MRINNRKSGQGMTEYIIIVAIIAIGAILIVGLFGQQIKGVFTGMGNALGGDDDASSSVNSAASALSGTESAERETMAKFDENQQE